MFSSVSGAFQEVVPLKFFKSKLLHQSGFYLAGRILQKAGLAGGAVPPVVLEKEWFAGKNPNGEYLRMIAKKP